MAYGYKRKRRYTRKSYRRGPVRRGRRARGRFTGRSKYPRMVPRTTSVTPAVVRALKRAAADAGTSIVDFLRPDKIARLADDATRFSNPAGVSVSEFRDMSRRGGRSFFDAARGYLQNDPVAVWNAMFGGGGTDGAIVPM